MQKHVYDGTFYDYVDPGARRSAVAVARLLLPQIVIRSLLDVGCGRGVWVSEWLRAGVDDAFGVDGDYVRVNELACPRDRFRAVDVSGSMDLGRRFDLVQTLEVAEHLPAPAAERFVDNLIRHGDLVLFSAAPPGQGGEFHVNEQPYGYWRDKFAARGFRLFDFIRPSLLGDRSVEPWYRFNSFLYASPERAATLPPAILATEIPPDQPIPDLAPLPWRLRRRVLSALPPSVLTGLAVVKHHLHRVAGRA